jgi:DNA-binding PadR family transcriptional regulator
VSDGLNEVEQLILLAILRLGDEACGVPVRLAIEDRARRSVSLATVYAALERMEARGQVESWLSDPLPERGGRARKHFRLTAAGARALRESREEMARMWDGLEGHRDLEVS